MENYKYKTKREFNCISNPQMELYNLLLKIFPDAEMEYKIGGRIKKRGCRMRFADIAIPSLKIDFEYDGWSHKSRSFSDSERDKELNEQGWKTIRINKDELDIVKFNINLSNPLTPKKFLDFIEMLKTKREYDTNQTTN